MSGAEAMKAWAFIGEVRDKAAGILSVAPDDQVATMIGVVLVVGDPLSLTREIIKRLAPTEENLALLARAEDEFSRLTVAANGGLQ